MYEGVSQHEYIVATLPDKTHKPSRTSPHLAAVALRADVRKPHFLSNLS